MDTQEKLAWLRLIRCQNIGPILFWNLLKLYGTAERALTHLPELAAKSGKKLEICSRETAEAEFYQHKKYQFSLLAKDEPEFPTLLKTLQDCPPLISIGGDTTLMQKPILAIVGSRNASFNNCRFAYRLASDLGQKGWIIVSGLARGIDRHAHEGALSTGTIAILAGGIDQIYPLENKNLYQKIREQGCLISEIAFGCQASAMHFPRRNRLISGVAKGVLIVEAALKSGSMITARYANEQGKDVFAIPGSPLDPRCKGGNRLLKDGAYLVESADDITQILTYPNLPVEEEPPQELFPTETDLDRDSFRQILLNDLDSTPLFLDDLKRKHPVSPGCFTLTLVELELAGLIRQLPNRTVIRIL